MSQSKPHPLLWIVGVGWIGVLSSISAYHAPPVYSAILAPSSLAFGLMLGRLYQFSNYDQNPEL